MILKKDNRGMLCPTTHEDFYSKAKAIKLVRCWAKICK